MRLNKYIADSGLCSRRKADDLIKSGCVNVNGRKVTELGFSISEKDKVFINNEMVKPKKHDYYRFYKPAGYITSANDEKGRKTIYDLLPKDLQHLKPVGRLDRESSGLLILTNDGDLINMLTHPSIKVPKTYMVTVDGKVHLHQQEQMANGIEIEKGKTAYADTQIIETASTFTKLKIVLYQGLNRQIRKMFKHFNLNVISLKRIQHATISIEGLKKGDYKPIKPKQLKELKDYLKKIKSGLE